MKLAFYALATYTLVAAVLSQGDRLLAGSAMAAGVAALVFGWLLKESA